MTLGPGYSHTTGICHCSGREKRTPMGNGGGHLQSQNILLKKKKLADYLSQDVLANIFTRLPIEDIVRCTSVCKSWKSLIKNPSFILSHLNRPRTQTYNNTHDLYLVRTCSVSDAEGESGKELYSLHHDIESFHEYAKLECPFHRALNRYYRIVGSCNGVLCLTDDQFTYVHNTILWNPTIRKWVSLPRPRVTFFSHGGFDHVIGFGFDAKSNDYKVVRIVHLDEGFRVPPEVDVYTLSTGTWRDISQLCLRYWIREKAPQAYVNGAAHWIGSKGHGSCGIVVVSFDMVDELFHILEPPAGVGMSWNSPYLIAPAVIQGSLAMVEQNDAKHSWCIWVMKEYGAANSWTKLFDVGFEWRDRVIGFRKKGELLIAAKGDLVSYDPKAAQAKKVGIRSRTGDRYEYSLHTESYTESLVLLGRDMLVEDDEVGSEGGEEDEVGSEEDEVTRKQAA